MRNIDDEVALLHDLKEIVLEFIRKIEQIDFNSDADVKMLYEKAKEIETQYVGKTQYKNVVIPTFLFCIYENIGTLLMEVDQYAKQLTRRTDTYG